MLHLLRPLTSIVIALWLPLGTPTLQAFELTPTVLAPGVYALIGPTGPRTAQNDALNCNIGFVVTEQGVVLIDTGASPMGAERIARAVDSVTDQPIRWVINTGSQDHRWLGNRYFAERGAKVLALQRTVKTHKRYADQHLANLRRVLGERLAGTEAVTAAPPLAGDHAHVNLGGVSLELVFVGNAHFPGDAVVWLPEQRVLFTGDLVCIDRLLGVLSSSQVRSWRAAFERTKTLRLKVIVPGHGSVGDLAKAQRDTGDYLEWLIEECRYSAGGLGVAGYRSNINRAHLDFERGGD